MAIMHPRKGAPDYADHRRAQKLTALHLIERGQHLVPVNIVNPETGRCTCLDRDYWTDSKGKYPAPPCAKNDGSWGKHPTNAKWQQSAPLDRAGLDREFTARPYLNLGVLCGTPIKDKPGFLRLAIDVDGRGGHKQLAELEAQLGPLPSDTYTVVTGREEDDGERSGRQLHFAVPASYAELIKSAQKTLAPEIDIRFVGSQVIAPGSMHRNGNQYYALYADKLEIVLEEGHPWLEYMAALFAPGGREEEAPEEPRSATTGSGPSRKRLEQFWAAVGLVSALRDDGRVSVRIHGKTYAQREPAINAAAYAAGQFSIPLADVERQLLAAALACGALAKYGRDKLVKTIRDAHDAGSKHPIGDKDPVPRDPDEIAAEYGVTSINAYDLACKQFPEIESILIGPSGRGLLETGTARPHGLFGYAEIGKSTLAHQLAKCVVEGIPFLGLTPLQCEVLYWKTEDGERQVQRELLAHGNVNSAGLHYLFSPEGLSLADNLSLVVAELEKFPGIRLVLFETLESFTSVVKENERDEWRTAFGSIRNLLCAGFPDKAFCFLHHFGKTSKGENPSIFNIRGSSNIPAHTADKIYLHSDPGRNDQRVIKATSRGSGFRLEETYLHFDPNALWSSIDTTKREAEKEGRSQQDKPQGKEEAAAWELLGDIKTVWPEGLQEKMTTKLLIERLKGLDGGRWKDYGEGGLNPNSLAKLLNRFGIWSVTVRAPEGRGKGYRRTFFDEMFKQAPEDDDAKTADPPENTRDTRDNRDNPHEQRGNTNSDSRDKGGLSRPENNAETRMDIELSRVSRVSRPFFAEPDAYIPSEGSSAPVGKPNGARETQSSGAAPDPADQARSDRERLEEAIARREPFRI